MKVLLLGMNYASTLNSLVIGFKENGIPVNTLSFEQNRSKYNDFSEIDCVFPNKKVGYVVSKWKTLVGIIRLFNQVRKADVIHVFSNLTLPTRYESKILYYLFVKIAGSKKKYITYVGSEVRIPAYDFDYNPYYKEAFNHPTYEYKYESMECSYRHQEKFSKLGFQLIGTPDTMHYIDPQLFDVGKCMFHSGLTAIRTAEKKSTNSGEILIIHAPSAPIAKGTKHVRSAIEQLQINYPLVQYKELQHVSNTEYQELVQSCDIYIDQLIWGFHGVAAIQAMALGKPVICYLDKRFASHTENCPIIQANPNTLFEVIENIVLNPQTLEAIGSESATYYQNNHTPAQVVNNLLSYYRL